MVPKMQRVLPTASDKQTKIRVPSQLLEYVRERAYENGRSLNAEILFRLVKTLHEEDVFNFNNKMEREHENI